VYRGAVTGDDWWTITANIQGALKCSALDDGILDSNIYQMYQDSQYTSTAYRTGWTNDYFDDEFKTLNNGYCTVLTDLARHGNCCIDSSTPFVIAGYTNTVFGFGTGHCDVGCTPDDAIVVQPLYKGMDNLNEYWVDHGQNIGSWLCQTSTCGGIGGFDPA
jgi:hypothetical protein